MDLNESRRNEMTLDYTDHHCKQCGKKYNLAWMNGGLCEECFRKQKLEEARQSIKEGEPDTFSDDYIICPYCGEAFEPDPSVKTEVPIKVNGETFNYCPHCGRNLQG